MYYVVSKHRIVVESEVPVQMDDYPKCEMVEGPPGVSLINYEVYEEGGKRKVRTKLPKNPYKLVVDMPGVEKDLDGYVHKAGGDPVKIIVRTEGEQYLPPIVTIPEGYDKSRIDLECTRGKLSTKILVGGGEVLWTPVDETIDAVIILKAMNFPPIQEMVRIKLI